MKAVDGLTFDVALHVVFTDRAAHDVVGEAPSSSGTVPPHQLRRWRTHAGRGP